MGARSHMYVKVERGRKKRVKTEVMNKGFLPLYFHWNDPENMIARAKQMIEANIDEYLLRFDEKEAWEYKIKAMTEVNYSAADEFASFSDAYNLKNEYKNSIKEDSKYKGRELTNEEKCKEIVDIFRYDNDFGYFYLSVKILEDSLGDVSFDIKYAFEDYYGDLLSAKEFIAQADCDPNNIEICNKNIELIEEYASLMTEEELAQYKVDSVAIMAEEYDIKESEVKKMVKRNCISIKIHSDGYKSRINYKTYNHGDYTYTLDDDCWQVKLNTEVTDRNRTTYGEILSEIDNIPVKNISKLFSYCTSLKEAPAIPDGVDDISRAFRYCTSLEEAPAIPESVEDMYGTFINCTSLTQAPSIPENVEEVSDTFMNCTSLTNAPEFSEGIKNMCGTFSGCTSLKEAPIIPKSVKDLFCTFRDCTALEEAPAIPEGVKDMMRTFSGCTSLKEAPIIPESVTDMVGTFRDCTSLEEAPIIPNGVKYMRYSFMNCTSLEKAPTIPESVKDMRSTFEGCTSLTEAPVIPEGVKNTKNLFEGCINLASAPDSVD